MNGSGDEFEQRCFLQQGFYDGLVDAAVGGCGERSEIQVEEELSAGADGTANETAYVLEGNELYIRGEGGGETTIGEIREVDNVNKKPGRRDDPVQNCHQILTALSEVDSSVPFIMVDARTQEGDHNIDTSIDDKLLLDNAHAVNGPFHGEPETFSEPEPGIGVNTANVGESGTIIKYELIESKNPNIMPKIPVHSDNLDDDRKPEAEGQNPSFGFVPNFEDGSDSGTEAEQAAFMKELESFFRERNLDFKPPRFYGEGLNCLKLWRAVIRLGGYDQVTSCKLWRQVGESFRPPKTCTTVSWSFRCFYEKALLEYERHKVRGGELHVASSPLSEPLGLETQVSGNQVSGSGRARRDAAARAMQGWHSQRLLGNGEVGDPIIKDKSSVSLSKRDKQLKSLSLLKRKKQSPLDRAVKVARAKAANTREGLMGSSAVRMDTMIADVGPPADWVKINVRRTRDCFEVYALVPGLLREEVRVQSDASGRLVISGEPEQPDNPWGVTPFKKVISLPSRIDAHQTSAVVTLHGQLFIRAPFEQPDL